MAWLYQIAEQGWVTAEIADHLLMLRGTLLDAELFVDFSREARHVRFEQNTETKEGIQGSVDNLLAAVFRVSTLVEVPWFELLEVAIAVR